MRTMNKRMIMLMAAALALLSASGQVMFTNVGQYRVIEETPEGNPDYKIYVIYNTHGVGMTCSSLTGDPIKFYTFESYPEEIPGSHWDGFSTALDQVLPNTGYIIEDGSKSYYCWVVNYADYMMELNDMFYSNDNPCAMISFRVDGTAPKIPYKTSINGITQYLDREIKLSYNTLVFVDSTRWDEQPVIETFESLEGGIVVQPPLCNTEFILTGDRFLENWGIGDTVVCADYYYTSAVACNARAVQIGRETDSEEEESESEGLGGSAPFRIIFTGYPTDGVVYRVWEMATDQEFENVILQYNQDEVDYTFYDAGTYYMRYMVANADGSCDSYSDVYTIIVSESSLLCPNIFSPGTTEGVNDIWKVSYKSLVEFHCWIYNRWGVLMCEFTDPGSGWDGTYHGKLVDTGVYYYVVTATGSDGVKYKKRGDITILHYKKGASGTSGNGTGVDTGGY